MRVRHRATALAAVTAIGMVAPLVSAPAQAAAGKEVKMAARAPMTTTTNYLSPGSSVDRFFDITQWPDAVFEANVIPSTTSTSKPCELEVARKWYRTREDGRRSFHVRVTNIGSIGCSGEIVAAGIDAFTTWSSGTLKPGASKRWTWNNANPRSSVYMVGLAPQSTDKPCVLDVARLRFIRKSSGEREFSFVIRNNGDVSCSATVLLARRPLDSQLPEYRIEANRVKMVGKGPVTKQSVLVPSLLPQVTDSGEPCAIEIDRHYFDHHPDSWGPSAVIDVKNLESHRCYTDVQWTKIS